MMSVAEPPMAAATPSGQLTQTRLAWLPPLQQTANHDDDKLEHGKDMGIVSMLL